MASPPGASASRSDSPISAGQAQRAHWLFAGSLAGARTAAILLSVTSTCHRHKDDAFAYVRQTPVILNRLRIDKNP